MAANRHHTPRQREPRHCQGGRLCKIVDTDADRISTGTHDACKHRVGLPRITWWPEMGQVMGGGAHMIGNGTPGG